MLEIDYNLFPLSDEEEAQIGVRARQLARRGKPPPLTPASHGRIVVVNPNESFTLHHVPDDLRRPLRRAMQQVTEASKELPGGQIAEEILEKSDEPIYGLIVEIHSRFPEAVSFLRQIPRIKFDHPKCNVMLHGEIIRVHDMLGEVLSLPGSTCDLFFDHVDSPSTLDNVEQLGDLLLELPRYPTLPKPFFSSLSIKELDAAEEFKFKELVRLYRTYGIGNIDELDISGKMKAKLIILDIPLSAIESIRFNKSVSEGFHAINLNGEIILATELESRGIAGRDIPFNTVKSIYRKLPGKLEEEISLDRVRAMRVNCFEGHISFLWKPTAEYLPLYEVKGMRLNLGAGNGGESTTVSIDRAIISMRGQSKFGEVRGGIRQPYLEHIFRESLGRQVKLQHYASKLKIACLGPMAAQTLKMLRSHGLGQLIPRESLYYLCDSYDQISTYYESQERVQVLYKEVLRLIAEVFGPGESNAQSPNLVSHRLPMLQEWARGEAPSLDEVNAEHLDTVYKEMRVFLNFTESEFRRVGEAEGGGEPFLARVELCQEALLQARHLGNLMGARYGQLAGRQSFPDFVFFGSDDETLRNRQEFYLPGLSFAGIFESKTIQDMMQSQDFEFSVFLEEQLSLAAYLMSQEFERLPVSEYYDNYFSEKLVEAEAELKDMRRTQEAARDRDSDYFKEEIERFVQMHEEELQGYSTDKGEEARRLEDQETKYFEALKDVNDYLTESGINPEDLLSGGNYIRALDRHLMQVSKDMGEKFKDLVRSNVRNAGKIITEKKNQLTKYLLAFSNLQKAVFQELQADYVSHLRMRVREEMGNLLERMHQVSKVGNEQLEVLKKDIEEQQNLLREDFMGIEQKIAREISKNQNTMRAIREANRKLVAELSKPLAGNSNAPQKILEAVEKRLDYGKTQIMKVIGAADSSYETIQSLRASYRAKGEKALELYFGQNELAMVGERKRRSRLQRMITKRPDAPLIPPPIPDMPENAEGLAARLESGLAEWREAGGRLSEFTQSDVSLKDMHTGMDSFDIFQRIFRNFRNAVRDKNSSQQYMSGLNNRLGELTRESENINEVVENSILPAQATYAERIHIPNIEKRITYLKQARLFVEELHSQSFEALQREFLDRAIFRRFYASQFRSGAVFGMHTEMPIYAKLTNVSDGIAAFHRNLRVILVSNGFGSDEISLTRLPAERLSAILQFIEVQKQTEPEKRHNYLVLPSTFTLSQALEIIQFKEELFSGLPQLLVVYISKFDVGQFRDDAAMRDRYFMAMKHNVIINIDDDKVIDNPKAIADYLVDQTLGCCHDISAVEVGVGAVTDHSRGDEAFPGLAESQPV